MAQDKELQGIEARVVDAASLDARWLEWHHLICRNIETFRDLHLSKYWFWKSIRDQFLIGKLIIHAKILTRS